MFLSQSINNLLLFMLELHVLVFKTGVLYLVSATSITWMGLLENSKKFTPDQDFMPIRYQMHNGSETFSNATVHI